MPRPKPRARFGLNEPAAGRVARASHRLTFAAGAAVALMPGLWTFIWNLVTWPSGISTLSNLCISLQLVALGGVLCAHSVTFNICEYTPLRDWLEANTVRLGGQLLAAAAAAATDTPLNAAQGFLFLYRGRAEMLSVLSVLSLGNTQWDAPTLQLLIPVRAPLSHRPTSAIITPAARLTTCGLPCSLSFFSDADRSQRARRRGGGPVALRVRQAA